MRFPLRRNARRTAVAGRVSAQMVALVATVVLTGASVIVALQPSPPATSTAAAESVGVSRTTARLSSPVDDDAMMAREFAAAQRAASARELDASELSDEVKAARQQIAERATRDAERTALANASPRELGQILAAEAGWTGSQWSCLDSLWMRESMWNPTARNASSGAYGIPQALPGAKMSSAGADWATNPSTQIMWGLGYIRDRYGSPCGAWSHSQGHGWY